MLKVMAKMGICTYQSYCGAQIFDAVGLSTRVRRQLLQGHRRGGRRRRCATRSPRKRCAGIAPPSATRPTCATMLDVGGDYAERMRGEDHAWTSETIGALAARRAR